jgi:hypothetical protein
MERLNAGQRFLSIIQNCISNLIWSIILFLSNTWKKMTEYWIFQMILMVLSVVLLTLEIVRICIFFSEYENHSKAEINGGEEILKTFQLPNLIGEVFLNDQKAYSSDACDYVNQRYPDVVKMLTRMAAEIKVNYTGFRQGKNRMHGCNGFLHPLLLCYSRCLGGPIFQYNRRTDCLVGYIDRQHNGDCVL